MAIAKQEILEAISSMTVLELSQLIKDMGMQIKGLEISQYMCKESLAQQGGFALANKGPQHDEAWLIFMDMVNKHLPTFERCLPR